MVKTSEDISFGIRVNLAEMQRDLTRASKIVRAESAKINQQLAEIRAGKPVDTGGLSNKDFIAEQNLIKANMQEELAKNVLNANQAIESQKKALRELQNPAAKARERLSLLKKETSAMFGKEFTQGAQEFGNGLDKSIPAINRFRMGIQHMKKEMQVTRQEFPAWALSTMFFGMQMVSVFRSVWSSATKTFNDIMHSVEGTITMFDHLEGATTYLRFVAGQALEPFIQYLLPIIDAVSDWIQGNQELFRTLMLIFGAGGVILTGTGLAALNFNAIVGAVTAMKGGLLTFGVTLTKVLGTISLIKGALIAIGVAAIIAMWQTNFAGFRDFVTNVFGGLWETIKSVFNNVLEIVKNVFALVKNIMTGDFEAASENLKAIGKNLAAVLIKLFLGIGSVLANAFIFAANLIKTVITRLVEFIIFRFERVARTIDGVFGTNLESKLNSARRSLNTWGGNTRFEYITAAQVRDTLGRNSGNMSVYNDNKEVNISIYQQPGEDAMSLARTVDDELMSRFTQ